MKRKLSAQNNKTPRNFINSVLNKLNLGILKDIPTLSYTSQIKKSHKIFLSPRKIIQENKLKEKSPFKCFTEQANNNNYKTLYIKDRFKLNDKVSNNILLNSKNRENNSNFLFKKYIIGNDIKLPYSSLIDYNNSKSNMPYYTFSNYNKLNLFSPIKNNSKTMRFENSSLIDKKSNKSLKNFKLSNTKKNNNNRILSYKKIIPNFLKNNNLDLNLYESFEINNYSNKNSSSDIKIKKNIINKITSFKWLRNNCSKTKPSKLVDILKKHKRARKYLNVSKSKNNGKKKKHNIEENHKNEDFEDEKDRKAYNIGKKLIDNPNSFIYLMFNKLKNRQFDEEGNIKKMDLKKRFLEYKKDLDRLEQKARFEIFNLRKERAIGNEVNMKGRIISSNTFFNLAFGGY